MKHYVQTSLRMPEEGKLVMTKVDDCDGVRNEQKLIRESGLWFIPDMTMYVYYTPTHWKDE